MWKSLDTNNYPEDNVYVFCSCDIKNRGDEGWFYSDSQESLNKVRIIINNTVIKSALFGLYLNPDEMAKFEYVCGECAKKNPEIVASFPHLSPIWKCPVCDKEYKLLKK